MEKDGKVIKAAFSFAREIKIDEKGENFFDLHKKSCRECGKIENERRSIRSMEIDKSFEEGEEEEEEKEKEKEKEGEEEEEVEEARRRRRSKKKKNKQEEE